MGGSQDGLIIKIPDTIRVWTVVCYNNVSRMITPIDRNGREIPLHDLRDVMYEHYRITRKVSGEYVGIYSEWEYR